MLGTTPPVLTSSILNCYQQYWKSKKTSIPSQTWNKNISTGCPKKLSNRLRLCSSSLGHPALYLVNQRERVFISWFWPCIVWELVNMCEDVFVVDRECLGPIMQHLKSGEKKFHKRHVPILQIYNLEEVSNYFFGKSFTFSLSILCLLNTNCSKVWLLRKCLILFAFQGQTRVSEQQKVLTTLELDTFRAEITMFHIFSQNFVPRIRHMGSARCRRFPWQRSDDPHKSFSQSRSF